MSHSSTAYFDIQVWGCPDLKPETIAEAMRQATTIYGSDDITPAGQDRYVAEEVIVEGLYADEAAGVVPDLKNAFDEMGIPWDRTDITLTVYDYDADGFEDGAGYRMTWEEGRPTDLEVTHVV